MTQDKYTPIINMVWKANQENLAECARQSYERFPLPPIFQSLEAMSDKKFSKLLADTQKRAFYLGALAICLLMDESKQ